MGEGPIRLLSRTRAGVQMVVVDSLVLALIAVSIFPVLVTVYLRFEMNYLYLFKRPSLLFQAVAANVIFPCLKLTFLFSFMILICAVFIDTANIRPMVRGGAVFILAFLWWLVF